MISERHARIRLKARMMPYLIGILLVVHILAPYRVWLVLLIGLGGATLIGWLWARELAMKIDLKREMRFGWVQVGDILEERFTLKNAGLFPALFAEVRDRSTLPEYAANQVRSVGPYGVNRWTVKTACSQRGLYEIGPTRVYLGDPLGIFSIEIELGAKTSLLVTPPIVPLPDIRVASGGRSGEGWPRPSSLDRTISVGGVREHQPEDAFRWIHWPTSARKDELFVRVFDGTPAGDWWILLDANTASIFGSGLQSTFEHGIILSASLAARGLRQGLAVGLVAGGAKTVWLPPLPGEARQWEIFRNLALLSPGETSMGQLLNQSGGLLKRQASLILITADASGDWIEDLLPLVWRGIVPTVILLDPVTFGGHVPSANTVATLETWGITRYVVGRDYLDQPDIVPGKKGQWEWRITATGKAIPVQRPDDLAWRDFS